MPAQHRMYAEHTPVNAIKWAEKIGSNTVKLINLILNQQVEKRALKIIAGIQNLEKKYSIKLIEEASEILLSIIKQPTLSTFKTIIKRQNEYYERNNRTDLKNRKKSYEDYDFSRGPKYYGGK